MLTQLWIGALLILAGAAGAFIFGVIFQPLDDEKIAPAIGSAVIGAGAAMLPPGAAGQANARLLRAAEDEDQSSGQPPPADTTRQRVH